MSTSPCIFKGDTWLMYFVGTSIWCSQVEMFLTMWATSQCLMLICGKDVPSLLFLSAILFGNFASGCCISSTWKQENVGAHEISMHNGCSECSIRWLLPATHHCLTSFRSRLWTQNMDIQYLRNSDTSTPRHLQMVIMAKGMMTE